MSYTQKYEFNTSSWSKLKIYFLQYRIKKHNVNIINVIFLIFFFWWQFFKNLQDSNWVDDATRLISIDFTIFNPSVSLFAVVRVVFEKSSFGIFVPWRDIVILGKYKSVHRVIDVVEIFISPPSFKPVLLCWSRSSLF